MIFVGIAATVLLLTTFPMLSELVTGRKVTMGPPIFNLVNIPWALVLLLLTGVGPLIAWRKATAKNLRRNFIVPTIVGLWSLAAMALWDGRAFLDAFAGIGRSLKELNVAAVFDHFKAFYPALTVGIGAFVVAAIVLEYYRGARVRVHNQGESLPVALGRMMWRNKRRYGGYVVHVGVVVVFIGIAASAAYQKEAVRTLTPGDYLDIPDTAYRMRYDGFRLEAVDDHLGSVTEITVFDRRNGKPIGALEAEQRYHPNMLFPELRQSFREAKRLRTEGTPEQYRRSILAIYDLIPRLESLHRREVKTPSTEVGILASLSPLAPSRLGEDFYVIPLWVDPKSGQANFRVFINPMVNFIWIGGLIFVIGAHLCVLPDARERKRLEAALELEERAVA
jgi:cytochrome c-type biogenesis protein CcmF